MLNSGLGSTINGKAVQIGNHAHFSQLVEYYREKGNNKLADNIEAQLTQMEQLQEEFVGDDALRDTTFVLREKDNGEVEWMMMGSEDKLRKHSIDTIRDLILHEKKQVVLATGTQASRAKLIEKTIRDAFSESEQAQFDTLFECYPDLLPGKSKGHEAHGSSGSIYDEVSTSYTTKTQIIAKFQNEGKKVMMVGDGMNDAPAMNKADISIGISDTAVSIVNKTASIMVPDIEDSLKMIRLSRDTDKKVNRNVSFAGAWMGFLVLLHFIGDKMKQAVGFELGATAKGILHEGSTLLVTMFGLRDAGVLADTYKDYGFHQGQQAAPSR